MRKILYSLMAVLAALSMTVGVAQARDHGPHGPGFTCTGTTDSTCTFGNGHTVPGWVTPCTIATGATSCTGNLPGGFGRPRFGGYPGLPSGFPMLNGNLLSLQALGVMGVNANINVCLYPSFQDFDAYAGPHFGGGWAMARNRWFAAQQAQAEWLALRQAAGCGVVVQGNSFNQFNGFNDYLNGSYLNLQQYGVGSVNLCAYQNFDSFDGYLGSRLGSRWGGPRGLRGRFGGNRGEWLNNFNSLRNRVGCPVIVTPGAYQPPVVQPQPVIQPTPMVTPDPGPAVTPAPPSGPTIIEVPSGPPATGDSGLAPNAEWVD